MTLRPVAWLRGGSTTAQVVIAGLFLAASLVAVVVAVVGVGPFGGGEGHNVPVSTPTAAFELEPTDGGVRLVHADGDAIPADQLIVEVGDQHRAWAALDDDLSPGGRVGVGAALVLPDATPGTEVQVRWTTPDGGFETLPVRAT